jgi:hypothetical protein
MAACGQALLRYDPALVGVSIRRRGRIGAVSSAFAFACARFGSSECGDAGCRSVMGFAVAGIHTPRCRRRSSSTAGCTAGQLGDVADVSAALITVSSS